jgi:predicted alpha/beta-hydrolase family hydrolase
VEVLLVAPAGDRAVPFVLFSPGFLLSGRAYQGTAKLLASHGIAVALLTYDVNLFNADHRALALDLRFVLGALPERAAARGVRLDPERVGLAGHSLGGKLSFLVAADERAVRAVAGLDPVDGGPPGADDPVRFPRAADRMADIAVPKLLLGAERGGEARFGTPCAPREANYERLFERATARAWEVTQLGAGHMDYLDDPNCGFACSLCVPGTDPARARTTAQTYLVLFFRAHLLGEEDELGVRLAEDEAAGIIRARGK